MPSIIDLCGGQFTFPLLPPPGCKPIIRCVTLRDGNQALKKPWNREQKLKVFELQRALGLTSVEAGFPESSIMDFETVSEIASIAPAGMEVAALARSNPGAIRRAGNALLMRGTAATPTIHTFIGMSPNNMRHVLKMEPEAVMAAAVEGVRLARELVGPTGHVQFSPEHFGDCEENIEWVVEVLLAAVEAGADIINLPNTVERYNPVRYAAMFAYVVNQLRPGRTHLRFSAHVHNDLGMGTATSLLPFYIGATDVEVALNGLGERAGNANLYEVVMALFCNGFDVSGINLSLIYTTALMVAELAGIPIPEKAAIVGAEAAIHRSGIHQNGMIRTREEGKSAYYPFDTRVIGRGSEGMGITSQSGANAAQEVLQEGARIVPIEQVRLLMPAFKAASEKVGELKADDLAAIYDAIQSLGQKKELQPADLVAVARQVVSQRRDGGWLLVSMSATAGSLDPTATVRLRSNGNEKVACAIGDGAVDASFKAIAQAVGKDVRVLAYSVTNLTSGADSQAAVKVRLALGELQATGEGVHTDVVRASVMAYLDALNLLIEVDDNNKIIRTLGALSEDDSQLAEGPPPEPGPAETSGTIS